MSGRRLTFIDLLAKPIIVVPRQFPTIAILLAMLVGGCASTEESDSVPLLPRAMRSYSEPVSYIQWYNDLRKDVSQLYCGKFREPNMQAVQFDACAARFDDIFIRSFERTPEQNAHITLAPEQAAALTQKILDGIAMAYAFYLDKLPD